MLDELTARGTLYKAFERVRENGGCRGADGLTIRHFAEHLEEEVDRLQGPPAAARLSTVSAAPD